MATAAGRGHPKIIAERIGLACGGSNRPPGMPGSEPTNDGRGRCAGVASVRRGACGNGMQRSRQALIYSPRMFVSAVFMSSLRSVWVTFSGKEQR
ncbi:hypothetical protein [Parapedobacter sp.]